MKYQLTPFSENENAIDFELIKFKERGFDFAILIESNIDSLPKTNPYRFGLIDEAGNKNWFFSGVSTTDDRATAIEVYNLLMAYCQDHNLGEPFAYKEYEKREQ